MIEYEFTELNVLYIALVIYILVMGFAITFRIKWVIMIAGLLWFVPIFIVPNTFITIVSVTMLSGHALLGITGETDDF